MGVAYYWDDPDTIELVTDTTLLSVPNLTTDFWIINSETMIEEDVEFVTMNFMGSDLDDDMVVISEDYRDARVEGDKRLYHIYANNVFWEYSDIKVIFNYPDYTNLGIENPENLTIYYCEDWDFDNENCITGWQESFWINKYINGDSLQMSTNLYFEIEAFAVGELLTGFFSSEIREGEKFDFSKIAENYQNKQKFIGSDSSWGDSYYRMYVPGFFYNCSDSNEVNISFNGEFVGTRNFNCYDTLPESIIEESLGGYSYSSVKNISLEFNGDLVFYDVSELIKIRKNNQYYYFGENDSTGVELVNVNSFGSLGNSEFNLENNNFSYFVVNSKSSLEDKSNLGVYVNSQFVGEIDLNNSNGEKARGFDIPDEFLEGDNLNITLIPETTGKTYLADVKMKTNFDPYYLTIVASPDAIPFIDDDSNEADFRSYGSLDEDFEGEFAVGRVMGITNSDVSSYLARILFFDFLEKETGAVMMVIGDRYGQGIPLSQCGTSFCKCYWDKECPELFARYESYFDPFITCNQDLINGISQESGTSDCEETERLQEGIFNKSSLSIFGDHGSPTGWAHTLYTSDLEGKYFSPQFGYSFACSSCSYGRAKANLFCTNMIRSGATGYIGAVAGMYGHHFLDEFLDETLINNKSIGYAFKIGKNKEARGDWLVKNTYSPDRFVHDILVGDPTFDGGFR